MSNQETSDEETLTLGGRINWTYILGRATLKYLETIVKAEGLQSEQEIREAALVMSTLIPDAWIKADKKYSDDKEKAIEKRQVDVRKEWCGQKIGEPKFETEEVVDPYKLAHACVNVFQRRGLLSRTIFSEKIVPTPEDFEEKVE